MFYDEVVCLFFYFQGLTGSFEPLFQQFDCVDLLFDEYRRRAHPCGIHILKAAGARVVRGASEKTVEIRNKIVHKWQNRSAWGRVRVMILLFAFIHYLVIILTHYSNLSAMEPTDKQDRRHHRHREC